MTGDKEYVLAHLRLALSKFDEISERDSHSEAIRNQITLAYHGAAQFLPDTPTTLTETSTKT